MDWILRRLRPRDRPPIVCYLRENGPIAYQGALFARDPREPAEAMLATGLTWCWKATSGDVVVRDWTELSRWSMAALLGDLAPSDSRPGRVLAVAIEPQDSADPITDARAAVWMRAFNNAAAAPLHAVVWHDGGPADLLFVAQQPPDAIRVLLHACRIDRDRAVRRAYARLGGQGLETLIGSIK
ncbi:MAG TPA: hypothetical protein VGI12_20180 [Vicinamibacterales bacterium]|jgi:hypothetical protein